MLSGSVVTLHCTRRWCVLCQGTSPARSRSRLSKIPATYVQSWLVEPLSIWAWWKRGLHGRKSVFDRSIYFSPFFPLLGSLPEMYLQLHLCAGTGAACDVARTTLCSQVYFICYAAKFHVDLFKNEPLASLFVTLSYMRSDGTSLTYSILVYLMALSVGETNVF